MVFATIPNAAGIVTGYDSSQLKKLVDAPESQPLFDEIQKLVGDKNLALLKVLLPDLSGQSFIALTHFDPSKPDETGFIAAMKPKAGTDNFDTFVTQVNAAYPDMAHETKTGRDKLLGVDYQWIEGAHSPGRVCVARYHGWIVTTWGEASLQDWLERMQGKPATPSLAENADYQKSLTRIGKSAQAVLYFDYRHLMQLLGEHMDKTNPGFSAQMQKQIASLGPAVIGTSFENGDIVDRFSILEPRDAQLANGMAAEPCPFETLKFTGPDTRFYLGAAVNWAAMWKNFQAQLAVQPRPPARSLPLSSPGRRARTSTCRRTSSTPSAPNIRCSWNGRPMPPTPTSASTSRSTNPDAFKPTIAALLDTARKEFATTAVITEMNSGGVNFATLKMVRPMPVQPHHHRGRPLVRPLPQPDPRRPQHGTRRKPRPAPQRRLQPRDRRPAPGRGGDHLLRLAQVLRPGLPHRAAVRLHGRHVQSHARRPPQGPQPAARPHLARADGHWGAVFKNDDDGVTGYSRSGIGNQGILLAGGLGGSVFGLEMAGILPHRAPHHYTTPVPGNPNAPTPPVPGAPTAPAPALAPVPATPPAPIVPVPSAVPSSPAAPATPPPPPMPTPPRPRLPAREQHALASRSAHGPR